MSFLAKLFKKRDPLEAQLRDAADKLRAYDATLTRELARLEAFPPQRAAEIDRTREECRKKLTYLYNWALNEFLDTFYTQAVLLMKRVWLRSLVDAAAIQALNDQLIAAVAWRRHLQSMADERARVVSGDAAATGPRPSSATPSSSTASSGTRVDASSPSGALPLDLAEFCTPASEVVRGSGAVRRLARRVARITARLAEIDEALTRVRTGGASPFRPMGKGERRVALSGMIVCESDAEVKDVAAVADAEDAIAAVAMALGAAREHVRAHSVSSSSSAPRHRPAARAVADSQEMTDMSSGPSRRSSSVLMDAPTGSLPACACIGPCTCGSAIRTRYGNDEPMDRHEHESAHAAVTERDSDEDETPKAEAAAVAPAATAFAVASKPPSKRDVRPFPLHPCARWLPELLMYRGEEVLLPALPVRARGASATGVAAPVPTRQLSSGVHRGSVAHSTAHRDASDQVAARPTVTTADAYAALHESAPGTPSLLSARAIERETSQVLFSSMPLSPTTATVTAENAPRLVSQGSEAPQPTSDEPLSMMLLFLSHGIVLPSHLATTAVAEQLHEWQQGDNAAAAADRGGDKVPSGVWHGLSTDVTRCLHTLRGSLLLRRQLKRDGAARFRDFHRIVADQRTREGRLLQRWCQQVLAQGLDGEYAFDMTRYFSFDPGPEFAEATRKALNIGLPVTLESTNPATFVFHLPPANGLTAPSGHYRASSRLGAQSAGDADGSASRQSVLIPAETVAVIERLTETPPSAAFVAGAQASGVQGSYRLRSIPTSAVIDAAVSSLPAGGSVAPALPPRSASPGTISLASAGTDPGRSRTDSAAGMSTVSTVPASVVAIEARAPEPKGAPTGTDHYDGIVSPTEGAYTTLGGLTSPQDQSGAAIARASTGPTSTTPSAAVEAMMAKPVGIASPDGARARTSSNATNPIATFFSNLVSGASGAVPSTSMARSASGTPRKSGTSSSLRYGGRQSSTGTSTPAGDDGAVSRSSAVFPPRPAAAAMRAAASSVPTPKTIAAFIKHLTQEIFNEYSLHSALLADEASMTSSQLPSDEDSAAQQSATEAKRLLRVYVQRLVFPRLHAILFTGFDVIPPVPVARPLHYGAAGTSAMASAALAAAAVAPVASSAAPHTPASASSVAGQSPGSAMSATPQTDERKPRGSSSASAPTATLQVGAAGASPGTAPGSATLAGTPGSVQLMSSLALPPSLSAVLTSLSSTGDAAREAALSAAAAGPEIELSPLSPPPAPPLSPAELVRALLSPGGSTAYAVSARPVASASTAHCAATGGIQLPSGSIIAPGAGGLILPAAALSTRLPQSNAKAETALDGGHADVDVTQDGVGGAAVQVTSVALPLRPNGSAADVLYRRDRVFVRRAPRWAAISLGGLGVDEAFCEVLPSDILRVPITVCAPTSTGEPVSHTFQLRYTYQPYSIASQLLSCMDLVDEPGEMLHYLSIAVDAMMAEADARAKLWQIKKELRAGKQTPQPSWPAPWDETPPVHVLASMQPLGAPPAVGADDMMPLLIYTCAHSSWRRPHACLSYIANYGIPPSQSTGRDGYILTMVQSAVATISRGAPAHVTASIAAATKPALAVPVSPGPPTDATFVVVTSRPSSATLTDAATLRPAHVDARGYAFTTIGEDAAASIVTAQGTALLLESATAAHAATGVETSAPAPSTPPRKPLSQPSGSGRAGRTFSDDEASIASSSARTCPASPATDSRPVDGGIATSVELAPLGRGVQLRDVDVVVADVNTFAHRAADQQVGSEIERRSAAFVGDAEDADDDAYDAIAAALEDVPPANGPPDDGTAQPSGASRIMDIDAGFQRLRRAGLGRAESLRGVQAPASCRSDASDDDVPLPPAVRPTLSVTASGDGPVSGRGGRLEHARASTRIMRSAAAGAAENEWGEEEEDYAALLGDLDDAGADPDKDREQITLVRSLIEEQDRIEGALRMFA